MAGTPATIDFNWEAIQEERNNEFRVSERILKSLVEKIVQLSARQDGTDAELKTCHVELKSCQAENEALRGRLGTAEETIEFLGGLTARTEGLEEAMTHKPDKVALQEVEKALGLEAQQLGERLAAAEVDDAQPATTAARPLRPRLQHIAEGVYHRLCLRDLLP